MGVLPVPGAEHHAVAPEMEGAAGRRGAPSPQAGHSLQEGAECGRRNAARRPGAALRGSGVGGGACTAGAGGGGYPGRCALKESSWGLPG